ncbi:MAG: aminoacyl-tRNA hydrolase [Xanthomonadales bacterium]|nr:aminoacyl-tRNA hydrolase [Xanthomonadales bacterium]
MGLGNPGPRYAETRHNAGFWFVEALAQQWHADFRSDRKLDGELAIVGAGDERRFLFKPQSFMNNSGGPVGALLRYYDIAPEELLIAYDELDLPPGTVRLKSGGGHGGHNGLRDVFAHLSETNFVRLRIGIGHPGHRDRVVGYVLSRPSRDEEALLRTSIDAALEVMPQVSSGELEKAMTRLHTKPAD